MKHIKIAITLTFVVVLASVMVFYGKILYLTDALLPEKEAALKMNYTNEEWP